MDDISVHGFVADHVEHSLVSHCMFSRFSIAALRGVAPLAQPTNEAFQLLRLVFVSVLYLCRETKHNLAQMRPGVALRMQQIVAAVNFNY